MKFIPLFIFILITIDLNAQSQALVYLNNGSQIKGEVEKNENEETIIIKLEGGNILKFNDSQIEHIDYRPKEFMSFENGFKINSKGTYKSFSFSYMSAKHAAAWQEGKRTGVGVDFSMGHYFFPQLGIGAGVGFDWHEQTMMPVYFELNGLLPHKLFSYKEYDVKGYQIPITYSIQVGHNFQVQEWISDPNEFERLEGGLLFYPSIGLAFPGRTGNTLKFDLGYKFQHYKRVYEYDWSPDYSTIDKVTLRSFSMRFGYIF